MQGQGPRRGEPCQASPQEANWTWLGRVAYEPTLRLQEAIREDILAGRARDTLLLLEHAPVITMGRHAQPAHVLLSSEQLNERGIAVCRSSRGGDVTFHGPGQLVGYPIFRLRQGVRAHVEAMAKAIIEWLSGFGISSEWRSTTPGVWVGDEKICAFGIHVRHRIAIHGFALNLSTDMKGFSAIVPCGLRDAGVTSLVRLLGHAPAAQVAARDLLGLFEKHFGVQLVQSAWLQSRAGEPRHSLANGSVVNVRTRPRIVVIYNRDFEGAESDPENKAREDVKGIADHIIEILDSSGYQASGLGITHDVIPVLNELRARKPAAVFNLCESIYGDNRFESLLPQLLELESIPFTGSGPFPLSLALRKEKVKEVLRAQGLPVPRGVMVSSEAELAGLDLRFPLIVKPAREDASVGITRASVVHDKSAMIERTRHIFDHYRQPALVEEFIEGREVYISLLGRVGQEPQVFPFFEIDFSDLPAEWPRIVSFEGKWLEDSVEYKGTRPVRCEGLLPELRDKMARIALDAFQTIGLRDYGRIDIRLTAEGTPYIIDVNPNCDLSDLAGGYSKAAKAGGLSYKDVILRLVDLALSRANEFCPTYPGAGQVG